MTPKPADPSGGRSNQPANTDGRPLRPVEKDCLVMLLTFITPSRG